MGFMVAASLGSHVVPRGTLETRIKCQLFCNTEKNSIDFKFSKHKAIQRGIFISKQEPTPEFDERKSPNEVREEIKQCYELINRLGRGVLYLGSARMGPDHSHYVQAQELAKEIANLLDCTTWSGAGPGLMDAVTQGALLAGKPVGGFKIGKEAGEWKSSNYHPYLPTESYFTCRFFSARKHGLVDTVVRNNSFDKTAVVALPGGIGTLDEVFEILALIQLERIGSKLPVPFMLMNYDSFYSKLLEFLNVCEEWGTVSEGEVAPLWKVCNSNSEALAYLEDFYCISSSDTSKNTAKLYNTHELPS
ncbi:PREDICTED: probable cytokinin riboside 5'-monophosphate phosphoribohydrolase LOGL3 [Lupinus angustifolius]|uniref:probable cytokinin riboside 5'-monophosphate phosphoribohydrolase LOGL3 n=1 Tax=Lupinus angustifolius TaxID=3871 RepID=UPI00092FCB98|nr:PREDICTED: probable cytokinin riboside 5'-monophosphate phosphoribohydrolase LOGL3 [Lupinus angustifolius]XP_019442876.1 PREDICTED: probable cytokinin riboside 5'-monophosphate phosphoribohydrolase LOGL3 [Lupinus angustifolius]XP_019442877.1 PREDICTED: probable cytokinin riboside 5'-monophosphate phosphoribohydrolase LOGL3 [Lupinus angustifolius]XP_019442878.1 PREDICTED: probable cytokinin riboside 5'-monophosphate phosphoribohydrolase LOGL3 [Lupinus angustifolius]XP_019442879.1 PREDICTED: p